MKNKTTLLIIAAIIAVLGLSAIQGYLISNAYQLEKDVFIDETNDAMSKIHVREEIELLFDSMSEELEYFISDYKNQRISKGEILVRLAKVADSLNGLHQVHYKDEINNIGLDYAVKYKENITSITVFEAKEIDTILPYQGIKKTFLFGENFNEDNSVVIGNSRLFEENDYILQTKDSVVTRTFDYEVRSQRLILIEDYKSIVFGRMALLLTASALIFLIVVGLFYYSIKNLITQKKTSEIKTDFINNITHELKTPLATLSIATKSLKNDAIKNNASAFENTLNIVTRQSDRLQKLVDQVMTNSLSSESISMHKEHVIDNVYFKELLEDFKLSTQRNDLTIDNQVYGSEVMLRIDKFHFNTALLNILENAVKYGKEKTHIVLKTELRNGTYHISIMDNGIGISEKNKQHLFDKFYRVSDGNVHDVKGLGLGLYYTHQIIKAHNGTIIVESELNKGTTFNIKIPVN
ncbi:two-component sensor histidine kinase [Patiriisocius marinistellae]|uniref:histidine kinase n=1 Tax=Patiriisocius marinistellae TaxID=2494560 RepID=A0A5J4FZS7_9FLAO|nr:HAMP domain-containing sensor histidine kinase [Patiriisocius marinistellae]GEQ86752.1 two-component sensor histidine kinase [Patiriisocius marinistellae]